MDFSGVTSDTSSQVSNTVDYILGLHISPDEKTARIADVVLTVGDHFHSQLYDASSEIFGSTIMASAGITDERSQAQRLALKIVRNFALGREVSALITSYYNSVLGNAQHEAFQNAISMQKHPTLTRRANRGKPDCDWCKEEDGEHTNPTPEDFGRHDKCDCLFIVSGANTRNGILNNYVKSGAKS